MRFSGRSARAPKAIHAQVRTDSDCKTTLFNFLDKHARLVAYTQNLFLRGTTLLDFFQLLKILGYFPRLKGLVLSDMDISISPSGGMRVPSTLETFNLVNDTRNFEVNVVLHFHTLLTPFSDVRELSINSSLLLRSSQMAQDPGLPYFRHLSSLTIYCNSRISLLVEIIKANGHSNLPCLQHLGSAGLCPPCVICIRDLFAHLGDRLTSATLKLDLISHPAGSYKLLSKVFY